jgi:hypothetical protein
MSHCDYEDYDDRIHIPIKDRSENIQLPCINSSPFVNEDVLKILFEYKTMLEHMKIYLIVDDS